MVRSLRVLVLAPFAALGVACGSATSEVSAAPAAVTPISAATPPAKEVLLRPVKFSPTKLTVKAGTPIVFKWKETVAHNIVFDNKGPKSKTQNKGTWSPDPVALSKPGTYKYKCTLHPGMNGQITVQ